MLCSHREQAEAHAHRQRPMPISAQIFPRPWHSAVRVRGAASWTVFCRCCRALKLLIDKTSQDLTAEPSCRITRSEPAHDTNDVDPTVAGIPFRCPTAQFADGHNPLDRRGNVHRRTHANGHNIRHRRLRLSDLQTLERTDSTSLADHLSYRRWPLLIRGTANPALMQVKFHLRPTCSSHLAICVD